MSNAPAILRSLVTFAVIVPLAFFVGYLLTNPLDYTTFAYAGVLALVLVFPLLLRWHYPLLLFSLNTSLVMFFMMGRPAFWLVMVVLSSIGLLVGGIGVMNIMLVSVTERTREIGVRKAIGARKSDIILQFLTEAVVLTVMGGVLGLLLGWSISRAAGLVFPNLPTAVPLWAAASGVAVSVGVGLFFGIWPASRAARLDPVEALRHE